MPLSLVFRSTNGAPLTAIQHDQNLTNIKAAVDANTTDIDGATTDITLLETTKLDTSAFHGFFEGEVSGKETIDWSNVVNKPVSAAAHAFLARPTGSSQEIDITGSGSVTGSAQVALGGQIFDTDGDFDPITNEFTAPIAGIYQFNGAIQMELVTGSPSGISIVVYIRKSGVPIATATLDLTGTATGTRIYHMGTLYQLAASDTVDMYVDISQTNAGKWEIASNENTNLSGYLVKAL